jgi:NAD(P)-dependent dehydrogenase (short-subunit alcohol dehydrogenase family)
MTKGTSLRTYQGAVGVITGGASGIGRALGEALARQGADVVLADRQIELARTVADGIRERGGRASAA